jgi:hypothetical protein
MASTTKKVKVRRAIAIARQGRKRKNHDRNHGSTACNLPLNMPNANEKAMKKA